MKFTCSSGAPVFPEVEPRRLSAREGTQASPDPRVPGEKTMVGGGPAPVQVPAGSMTVPEVVRGRRPGWWR